MQGSLNSGLRERGPVLLALVSLLAVGIAACSSNGGNIDIDGSSTVFPITVAMAEEFGLVSDVRVQVGLSGTGGGFDKFCRGETQVSNASRPIKASEVEACAGTNDEIIEFQV
ncbi:MAG: substrate-binding domain-containing protein, partial [Dehalococcoidia bacterium]|nr:substrate-binding domain-containing protein [Dehalococcoidia bacterium]